MSVLVVAQLYINDIGRYRQYQEAFAGVFSGFGGRAVCADEAPEPLEGDWRPDKVVILEFETAERAHAFLDAPAYRRISVDRQAGANTRAVLVQTLPAPDSPL